MQVCSKRGSLRNTEAMLPSGGQQRVLHMQELIVRERRRKTQEKKNHFAKLTKKIKSVVLK